MKMETEVMDNVQIITLTDYHLDESNVKKFKAGVESLIEIHNNVLLDFTNLTFVDSSGLGGILSLLRKMSEKGGHLKICNVSKPINSVFDLIRLPRLIDIFESRESGIKAFK
jgi:anti-sigma B factor antagonist